jgi:heme/copper-type cytochrome/quinol oxidase subunit 1
VELDHHRRPQADRDPVLLLLDLLLPGGGVEALFIRTQLIVPENNFISADSYNQMFTQHALTMIFLALMPLTAAFFNYIVPLQIGARDVAFPRLNALSYWVYFFGGLMLLFAAVTKMAPNVGWFAYAPITERQYNPAPTWTSTSWASRSSACRRSWRGSTSSSPS